MQRRSALIALLIVVVLATVGLSLRARAQTELPDCTVQTCVFLPLIEKWEPPTPTNTPSSTLTNTPTNTPTPSNTPTITNTPSPTNTPTLPPPTLNGCQADPNPSAAPNYPIKITNIDKVAETVTLKNMTTGDTIDLSGWTMCSITGNQTHPIGGTLAPGQSQTFPGPSGLIWNNSVSDPGALYNPEGRLVSYYPD